MAGIGFEIGKVLKKDTYLSTFQGYFYGALISSGPWIFTVTSLLFLNLWSENFLDEKSRFLFQGTVTFSFALSLILTGPLQMSLSRYLADHLYRKEFLSLMPSFLLSSIWTCLFSFIVALIAFSFLPGTLAFKSMAVQLYILTSLLWIILIFLSVLQDYERITFYYFYGSLLALLLGGIFSLFWKVHGLMAGFLLGEIFILAGLCFCVLRELPLSSYWDWKEVLFIVKNYSTLVWIGIFYNLGIWIDKIVFWWGPESRSLGYFLRFNPLYDNTSFLAFLSVIPTISLFMIRVETSFYQTYQNFYGNILHHRNYEMIEEAKKALLERVELSMARLFKLQMTIAFFLVVFAPVWMPWLGLKWLQISLVRYLVLGASFHILFFLTLLFFLYFDLQKEVFGFTLSFCIFNGVLSYITTFLGPRFYGLGYLTASFIHYIIAWQILFDKLKILDYITFVVQTLEKSLKLKKKELIG